MLHASQGGTAERLAWQTADWLRRANIVSRVEALGRVDPAVLANAGGTLFVVAIYGEGDPPDSALTFFRRWIRGSAALDLSRRDYGVLALGNRRYENFCGFGRHLSRWLGERGARAMFDTVEAHEA